MSGRPITRQLGVVYPTRPVNGTAGAAVTVTGIVGPNGDPVQTAWGVNALDAPAAGWGAATSDAGGAWSRVTVYPAAGTWWLWARLADFPRLDTAAGPVTVT